MIGLRAAPIHLLLLLASAQAAFKDFIIENEDDLQRISAENDVALMDEDAIDDELMSYEGCSNAPMDYASFALAGEDDQSYHTMDELVSNGIIDLATLKHIFAELAKDPKYAQVLPAMQLLDGSYNSEDMSDTSCPAKDMCGGEPDLISENFFNML